MSWKAAVEEFLVTFRVSVDEATTQGFDPLHQADDPTLFTALTRK
jgi:hypothetical protein